MIGLLLLACKPGTDPGSVPDASTESTGIAETTGATGLAIGTADTSISQTADTGPTPTFDCSTMPDMPLSTTTLTAPRGYNDVVFDFDGAMIGHDGNGLIKATSDVDFTIYAPSLPTIYKMGFLPTGETVAASSNGGVIVVDPSGGSRIVAPDLRGYGLAVGNDGMVYLGTNYTSPTGNGIVRIDVVTEVVTNVVAGAAFPPRAIGFSRDYDALYFGTLDGGDVWKVPLDANLDPTGLPELLVTVPTAWHDTLEVDACGNLYVGSVFCSCIYRINADLSVDTVMDWDFNGYGHGMEWGDPEGGWDEQSVYVTHPYIGERISEVDLGVPGMQWVGNVIGGTTL